MLPKLINRSFSPKKGSQPLPSTRQFRRTSARSSRHASRRGPQSGQPPQKFFLKSHQCEPLFPNPYPLLPDVNPPQNLHRHRLIPHRPHTRRAPILAFTRNNQFPSPSQKKLMRPKKRLTKSNPPRISVIQIKIRLKIIPSYIRIDQSLFFHHRRLRNPIRPNSSIRRTFSNSRPQIPPVAHQKQRSHRLQRIKQSKHPSLPLRNRKSQ